MTEQNLPHEVCKIVRAPGSKILHLRPKILDVSVFGLPDPVMGSIVACAIVSRPKVPQRIFFVPDLPRNPGGKVIKGKLIEQFQKT